MSLPAIYAGRRKKLVWLLVANGLAQAGCGLAMAIVLRSDLFSEAFPLGPWIGAAAIVGLGLILVWLRSREAADAEEMGQDYVTRVRLRIFDRVAGVPSRRDPGRRWGLAMTRMISDLNSLRNWVSLGFARTIVATMTIGGLAVGIAFVEPISAGILLSMTLGVVGTALAIAPLLRTRIRESRRRRGRLANNLGEKLIAARTVAQLARSRLERRRVRRDSRRLSDALVRRARLGSLLRAIPDLAMSAAVATLALLAWGRAESSTDLVVGVLVVGFVATALRDIARAWDQRLAFDEGRRRIESVLAVPRLRRARRPVPLEGAGPLAVAWEGVSVDGILHDVSHEIEPGEHVTLVGASGSGKSTLLALAARMLDPDAGLVRLGGVPIRALQLEEVRAAVALISPEILLLRGTIGENVLSACVEASPDPAWVDRVLACCRLDARSPLLPQGLETPVDEQGLNLSSATRARVALARACIARPRVLLVDDPAFLIDVEAVRALEDVGKILDATIVRVGSEVLGTPREGRIWQLDRKPSPKCGIVARRRAPAASALRPRS